MAATAGLWGTRRRVLAVIADRGVLLPPVSAAWTGDSLWGLLQYLGARSDELVMPEGLLHREGFGDVVRCEGFVVWCAPDDLVEQLRCCCGHVHRHDRYTAAMLARLPGQQTLRHHLHRLSPARPQDQLVLW